MSRRHSFPADPCDWTSADIAAWNDFRATIGGYDVKSDRVTFDADRFPVRGGPVEQTLDYRWSDRATEAPDCGAAPPPLSVITEQTAKALFAAHEEARDILNRLQGPQPEKPATFGFGEGSAGFLIDQQRANHILADQLVRQLQAIRERI